MDHTKIITNNIVIIANNCLYSKTDQLLHGSGQGQSIVPNFDSLSLLKRLSNVVDIRILNEDKLIIPSGSMSAFYNAACNHKPPKRILSRNKLIHDIVTNVGCSYDNVVILDKDVSYSDFILNHHFKKVKDDYFFWGEELKFIENRLGIDVWNI